jgi:hypothetical protein
MEKVLTIHLTPTIARCKVSSHSPKSFLSLVPTAHLAQTPVLRLLEGLGATTILSLNRGLTDSAAGPIRPSGHPTITSPKPVQEIAFPLAVELASRFHVRSGSENRI